jgi:hypothetical protein
MGWMAGVEFPAGTEIIFSLLPYSDRLWGPSSLLSNGYRGALCPRVKWLRCGDVLPFLHSSSLCGAKLSTEYIFMMWYFAKHRDNFTVDCTL